MVNISERPKEVEDRAVPGDWEGDLIIGKGNGSAIGTLVERSTNYTMLIHLPDGYRAEQMRDALTAKIKTLPGALRHSLTWDQGIEMRDWKTVTIHAGIEVYFCEPHSPWQRGSETAYRRSPTGTDLMRSYAIRCRPKVAQECGHVNRQTRRGLVHLRQRLATCEYRRTESGEMC